MSKRHSGDTGSGEPYCMKIHFNQGPFGSIQHGFTELLVRPGTGETKMNILEML